MKYIRLIPILAAIVLLWTACDKQPPIEETGGIRLSLTPTVSGEDFEASNVYTTPEGRQYRIDFFRLYLSDISLVREDGTEKLLSEVNLFDLAEGGPAKRVGSNAFTSYLDVGDIETGNYQGIKFGVGLPDRLNVDPANYAIDHPLSVGNQMYWSWRAGYKFISIEGYVDSTANMAGTDLGLGFVYHTGKDSVTSPNPIYRELSFVGAENTFSLGANEQLDFEIELDITKIFFSEADTIDLVKENFSHSVPGEQFDLSVRVTNNLADYSLRKMPF